MHAFAGDSSVGPVPTEASNAGTVLSNANASELCLICNYKSHSLTPLQNCKILQCFWSKFEHCGSDVWYIFRYVELP